MMTFRLNIVALLVCSLAVAGTGCVFVPVSTSRQPISGRAVSDFDFLKSGQPSRSEIDGKLGKPEEYFEDLQVSAYPINTVIRRKLLLFLGIIPVNYFRDYDGYETAYIQFDKQDRVLRCGISIGYLGFDRRDLEYGAKEWLAAVDPSRRKSAGKSN